MVRAMVPRPLQHTAVRRERNPRGEGGRLRDELIEAASELMARHGSSEAATIRAVARQAGVSAPSVYLHFADREALVHAVVERRFRDLIATIAAASAEAGPQAAPDARLRAGCRGYVRYGLEHPGHYRVLFDTSKGPFAGAAGQAGADAFGTLVEGIAECQAAGLARAGDPRARATAMWSAMHGLVMLRIVMTTFGWGPPEPLLDDMLVGLVGIPPAPPAGG